MIAHLSALAAFVVPFGNMLGPLIVWQMKKEEMPLAGAEALEALNFHITVSIAFVAAIILSVVLIGFLLMPVIGIGALAFTIIGAIQANQGTPYKYPFSWRLVS